MSGYRLPADLRLGAPELVVSDLARSVEYYQVVLGLEVLSRSSDRAQLGAGGSPLVRLQTGPAVAPARGRGRLGLFHFALLLPDRPSLGRFLAHLEGLSLAYGASDHLVSEAIYLRDPDGLGIEVYADRPQSDWRQVDGELEMATIPLNQAAVLAAARGATWDGMPDGTQVGHMHLHVGDIGGAARFYEDALGFSATVRSYPGALFLAAGGYHHHLGLNTWAGPDAVPPTVSEARLEQWELILPRSEELDGVAASLIAAGIHPERQGDGLLVRDPWGTALRLTAVS